MRSLSRLRKKKSDSTNGCFFSYLLSYHKVNHYEPTLNEANYYSSDEYMQRASRLRLHHGDNKKARNVQTAWKIGSKTESEES